MNINSLVRLPWKVKDVLRSMRRDLADSRRTMAELLQMISALELRHARGGRGAEAGEPAGADLETWNERGDGNEEMSSLREMLLGEIREQGLLTETAARFSSRAAAEMKLRNQLTPPLARERRCERLDHLLEPCRLSGSLGCECHRHARVFTRSRRGAHPGRRLARRQSRGRPGTGPSG